MKKCSVILLLMITATAYAADPQPLPANPFQNLPSQPETRFDPFADDDEEPDTAQPPNVNANSSAAPTTTPGSQPHDSKAGYEDPTKSKMMVESFDYPDAEIIDVARAVSRLTGKNFIYNPQDIKGRISITSETPITVADAWNAFLAALNMKGFSLVPTGKHYRIERVANAHEKQVPVYADDKGPKNEEMVTQILQLRYIDAQEAEAAFRFFIPRDALIRAFTQTNTLIVTDTATDIERLKEIISYLDVAGHQESIYVVPIRNAAAKDIAKMISDIMAEGGTTAVATRPTSNFNRPAPSFGFPRPNSNNRKSTGGSSFSKIIADDRTNSLIVKANAAGIAEIRAIVRRLDTKVSTAEGSGKIHVYRLQFAEAEALAKTLMGFAQDAGKQAAPKSNNPFTQFVPPGQQANAPVFQGDIKVTAEPNTQSLVITASPGDYATVRKVIEQLDVPRDQVFVQAIVMEMRMNRDNAFGTSFVSAPNGTALPSASSNLTSILSGNPLAAGGLVLGFKHGPSRSVDITDTTGNKKTISFNDVNGLVEFIQANTDANVLATPQILALDNKEATMEISDEIKVPQNTVTQAGVPLQSFTNDKASLILKVKPQINKASNFVKMDITQKLENFDNTQVPAALQTTTQGKNTRSTETSVIVQNEDTVVLSGLIREQSQETVRKVPILGDIPILGWLFKNSATQMRKTNLLVFITPSIIKQYDSIRKILTDRLEEREEFVKEYYGTKDPFGKFIKKMKGKLPDLHVFAPLPRAPDAPESTTIPGPLSSDEDQGNDQGNEDWSNIPPPPPPPIPWGDVNPPPAVEMNPDMNSLPPAELPISPPAGENE